MKKSKEKTRARARAKSKAKRSSKPKKATAEARWRTVERVAALIERLLDPAATVQHNVNLPDLITPTTLRQCDVVVDTGPAHRRTRSIVEVQKRGKRVEIGMFDSWVVKMHSVGAQHLICVSEAGYSQSIVDKAAVLGPAVRLCTLRELGNASDVLNGFGNGVALRTTTIRAINNVDLLVADSQRSSGTLKANVPAFTTQQGFTLTLDELARVLLGKHISTHQVLAGEHKARLQVPEPMQFVGSGEAVPVRAVRFEVDFEVQYERLELDVFEYRQLPDDGPLSWALVGSSTTGPDRVEVKVSFSADPSGRLVPKTFEIDGMPRESVVTVSGSDGVPTTYLRRGSE